MSDPSSDRTMEAPQLLATLEEQLLQELEACEIADADVYVPFLTAMLEDADPLADDAHAAREALDQVVTYVSDGVENGISSRAFDEAQVDRLWQRWRADALASAPPVDVSDPTTASAAAAAAPACDLSSSTTTCSGGTPVPQGEGAGEARSPSPRRDDDDEAAALRARTLALAHRGGGDRSTALPTVDNHSAVLAKARAEVAQVRADRFQRKEEAKSARQERAADEERKRNHRLNISAAKEKQETLRREAAQQKVKAEKDAAVRRRAGEVRPGGPQGAGRR